MSAGRNGRAATFANSTPLFKPQEALVASPEDGILDLHGMRLEVNADFDGFQRDQGRDNETEFEPDLGRIN